MPSLNLQSREESPGQGQPSLSHPAGYSRHQEHLFEELRWLDLLCNALILRQRSGSPREGFNEFRGLFISDDEIDLLTDRQETASRQDPPLQGGPQAAALESAAGRLKEEISRKAQAALQNKVFLRLPVLAQLFGLSPFELDCLLVCLAPELDLKYEKLYAYLQDDVTRKRPNADLILKLLCNSIEERLQARLRLLPSAPLFSLGILRQAADPHNADPALLSRPLKLDGRIAAYLFESDVLDEKLGSFAECSLPQLCFEDLTIPPQLKQTLARLAPIGPQGIPRIFYFYGSWGTGKKEAAQAISQASGLRLLEADLAGLQAQDGRLDEIIQRLFREARLQSAALYLSRAETLLQDSENAAQLRRVLFNRWEKLPCMAIFAGVRPWGEQPRPHPESFFELAFDTPGFSLRRTVWEDSLRSAQTQADLDADPARLAGKFRLSAGQIRQAAGDARKLALMRGSQELSSQDLEQACRHQSRSSLSSLASKIEPLFSWPDIVLPPDSLTQLKEICLHVISHERIFGEWGFRRKMSLGKGLSVLFIGPSGTGKTMAAEIIAGELGLDLYKIDLSGVVSKYIGETEKNLSRVFEAAERSNSILFFDEADSIFGKRSQVKDSHDRYANIEINYLLQKIEENRGIVILASNFHKNIDEAFIRRLRFIVEFPAPEEEDRLKIWKKVFPDETPLAGDIDFDFLAKFKVTGGIIKNIALNAAFLAASGNGEVGMEQLVRSTRRVFQKMGKLCTQSDFEGYSEWFEEGQ